MLITDNRREGDREPLPENWGLAPKQGKYLSHLLWIVDLDRLDLAKWGLGEVKGGELIIWVGPMTRPKGGE